MSHAPSYEAFGIHSHGKLCRSKLGMAMLSFFSTFGSALLSTCEVEPAGRRPSRDVDEVVNRGTSEALGDWRGGGGVE